jgi:uncharacterized membrane protein SpoIIM required for sporulation
MASDSNRTKTSDTPPTRPLGEGRLDSPETPTEELARLLDNAESHRLKALPFDDLRRLARLYRGEAARLSRLRDRGGDLDRIGYLNSLCVRAHALLYSARPRKRNRSFFARAAETLSAGLAGSGPIQLVAWAIMGLGAFIGYALVVLDPIALYALMPGSLGYDVGQIDLLYRSPEARALFFERDATPVSQNVLFGSYLFANNTRVGILAFATGMLMGVPTLLLQLFNGIMLGAIGAIFLQTESAVPFLAWILPHGVPELTAITLCATAGLSLGRAVAAPGRLTRAQALRGATPQAIALFLVSVPLFFAAAGIESFIRESALDTTARFAVAAAALLVLLVLAWLLTKTRRPHEAEVDWIDDLLFDQTASSARQAAP